jgi:hypothetical protein
VSTLALPEIQRPLKLGELLAATVKIYSGRGWTYAPLGVIQGLALVLSEWIPVAAAVAIYAAAFTLTFALVARLVAGDALGTAARRTLGSAGVLAALALVVGVPFVLGSTQLLLLVFSALWLGLTSFAIPAAMVERAPDAGFPGRLSYVLRRTTTLARTEYWHAVGIAAALIVIYILLGIVLAIAIQGASGLDQRWSLAATQVPLAPFFFIGLSVLYFEQRARAGEGGQAASR